ncbi:hypothetical protein H1R20_g6960, partial [Candolleomyces eurysporus]
MALAATSPFERDKSYFWDSVTFLCEKRLFRVPKYRFLANSEVFASKYGLTTDTDTDSEYADVPITLDASADDFRNFLKALYPKCVEGKLCLKQGEWISVLKLSTEWHFNEFRKRAITALSTELKLGRPVDKVALGLKYNVSPWLKDGFFELVTRKEVMTVADAGRIRWQSAITLYGIRDAWNTTMVKNEDVLKRTIHEHFEDDLQAMYNVERLHLTAQEKEKTKRLKQLEMKEVAQRTEEPLRTLQAPSSGSAAPHKATQAQPSAQGTQRPATTALEAAPAAIPAPASTSSPVNTKATIKQYRTVVHVDKLPSPSTAPTPPSATPLPATNATPQASQQPRKKIQKDISPPFEVVPGPPSSLSASLDASIQATSSSSMGFGGAKPTGMTAGGLNASTQSSSSNSSTFTFSGKLFTGIS